MILAHLPALQVVLPLLCAPFCLLSRWNWFSYGVAFVASWLTFAISIELLMIVLASGPISYHMGGWPPPFGIEYVVDTVNAYVLLIVSALGALVITFGKQSVERELPLGKDGLFYTAYLLCLAGLLGVTITGDAFNIFVFLEISSLSSYVHQPWTATDGFNRRVSVPCPRYCRRNLLFDWCRTSLSSDRYTQYCRFGDKGR